MCERCTEQGRETQFAVMANMETLGQFMLVMENVNTGQNMAIVADMDDMNAVILNLTEAVASVQAEIAKRN